MCLALGLTGGALGATGNGTSAASDQYDRKVVAKVAGTASTKSSTAPKPALASSSSGDLPFTGVSLLWPALGAAFLLTLGFGLRRHGRNE